MDAINWDELELGNIKSNTYLDTTIKSLENGFSDYEMNVDNNNLDGYSEVDFSSLIPFVEDKNPNKRKCEDNEMVSVRIAKRSKRGEFMYEIDKFVRNYKEFRDIGIEKCEIGNVNLVMERNKNRSDDIYESKCYRKPSIMIKKTGIREVEFKENDSFKYCVLYDFLLNDSENVNRNRNYKIDTKVKVLDKISEKVNFDKMNFPVNPVDKSIKEFERVNNVSIVIFGVEDGEYVVLKKSEYFGKRTIYLVYVKYEERCGRYYYVENPKTILACIFKDEKNLKNNTFCRFCLNVFRSDKTMNGHKCWLYHDTDDDNLLYL